MSLIGGQVAHDQAAEALAHAALEMALCRHDPEMLGEARCVMAGCLRDYQAIRNGNRLAAVTGQYKIAANVLEGQCLLALPDPGHPRRLACLGLVAAEIVDASRFAAADWIAAMIAEAGAEMAQVRGDFNAQYRNEKRWAGEG